MMKTIEQEFDPAIPVSTLSEHPQNPRRGDSKAVGESIASNGFYGAVLVQRSTGRVLAGHTRLKAARQNGATSIPGIWLSVDDEQAKRILLADNRTSDLAYYDDDALFAVLGSILNDGSDLTGTGYDDATYKLLLRHDADPDDLYVGNVTQGLSSNDRVGLYEGSDIRSIILPYSGDTYEEIVSNLTTLRALYEVKTNADVVRRLLEEAVKE
jgi:hypothetical protein